MRGKNNSYLSLIMIPHRLFFIPETVSPSKMVNVTKRPSDEMFRTSVSGFIYVFFMIPTILLVNIFLAVPDDDTFVGIAYFLSRQVIDRSVVAD